jgi:hypothetical protein
MSLYVESVIFLRVEAGLAVVTALDDMLTRLGRLLGKMGGWRKIRGVR